MYNRGLTARFMYIKKKKSIFTAGGSFMDVVSKNEATACVDSTAEKEVIAGCTEKLLVPSTILRIVT